MLNIRKNYNLENLSTFKIKSYAKFFVEIDNIDSLFSAIKYAQENNLNIYVLGDGSNTVWVSDCIDRLVIKLNIKGKKILKEDKNEVFVEVSCGENWDELVGWSVSENYQGIECLSLIPGKVGSSPIQNIGAYGQEVSSSIYKIKGYDIKKEEFLELSNSECHFAYRDSIFKNSLKDRFIILSVIFKLNKNKSPDILYEELSERLKLSGIINPSLHDVRNEVINIRTQKLPDLLLEPNVGSFFGNVFVNLTKLKKLIKKYPEIKYFETEGKDSKIFKIPTAWILDKALNLKGFSKFGLKISEKQALVIVNATGSASPQDVVSFKNEIIEIVKNKTGIELVVEPNLIS